MEIKQEKAKERRRKERLSGYHLLKYRLFDQAKEGPYILSSVLNISSSGLLFKANAAIPLQAILDLKINFPTLEEPLRTLAKVVRSRQVKVKPGYFEVGASFIDIDAQKTFAMDEAIKFVNKKLQAGKSKARG